MTTSITHVSHFILCLNFIHYSKIFNQLDLFICIIFLKNYIFLEKIQKAECQRGDKKESHTKCSYEF